MTCVSPLTEDHVRKTCKPGQGDAYCAFLVNGPGGWQCAKNTGLHPMIAERLKSGTMRAKGDNCDGMAPEERRLF